MLSDPLGAKTHCTKTLKISNKGVQAKTTDNIHLQNNGLETTEELMET